MLLKDKKPQEINIKHIAFIMDGNGRWASKRGLPREFGHRKGADAFRKVLDYCGELGISATTFYVFSTENWKRPKAEVDALMKLLDEYLDECKDTIMKKSKLFTRILCWILALLMLSGVLTYIFAYLF